MPKLTTIRSEIEFRDIIEGGYIIDNESFSRINITNIKRSVFAWRFSHCKFETMTIKETDFSYCNFFDCVFNMVVFINCNFEKANFVNCHFCFDPCDSGGPFPPGNKISLVSREMIEVVLRSRFSYETLTARDRKNGFYGIDPSPSNSKIDMLDFFAIIKERDDQCWHALLKRARRFGFFDWVVETLVPYFASYSKREVEKQIVSPLRIETEDGKKIRFLKYLFKKVDELRIQNGSN